MTGGMDVTLKGELRRESGSVSPPKYLACFVFWPVRSLPAVRRA